MPRTAKHIPDLDLKLAGSNKRVKISGKIGTYSSPELLSHIANENSSSTAASAPGSSAGASELQLKCFRISGVPLEWSDHDLLSALRSLDQSLEHLTTSNVRISLYRACYGSSQTALLNLTKCPEHFQHIKQDVDSCVLPYGRGSSKEIDLLIDSHFYGFTPLNTPEGEPIAE